MPPLSLAELQDFVKRLDDIDNFGATKELPYEAQTTDTDLKDRLDDLSEKLAETSPQTNLQNLAKDLSKYSVEESDKSSIAGNVDEAESYYHYAQSFLDIAVGLDPFTGFARDLLESVTGKNIITGQLLSKTERSFAIISVISLDVSSKVGRAYTKAIKALKKISLKYAKKVKSALIHFKSSFRLAGWVMNTSG